MKINSYKQKARGFLKELIAWISVSARCRNIRASHPMLIYQMGKVGSSSVVKSIQYLKLHNPVFHIHTLNKQYLEKVIKVRRSSVEPYLPEHLVVSKCLTKKISKGLFPCKIITLTREPVSRAISHVFEDWQRKALDAKMGHALDPQVMEEAVLDLVSQRNGISDPTIWFDSELKSCFNIDVFSVPFDHEKGFAIFKSEHVSVLLLRMEDINWALGDALVEFLDIEKKDLALVNANVGKEKWYAESLKKVKRKISFSESLLENIINTRYVNHFYYDDISEIRKKWAMKSSLED